MRSSFGSRSVDTAGGAGRVQAIWSLIRELADYERLTHAVTGNHESLEKHLFDDRLCLAFVLEADGLVVAIR